MLLRRITIDPAKTSAIFMSVHDTTFNRTNVMQSGEVGRSILNLDRQAAHNHLTKAQALKLSDRANDAAKTALLSLEGRQEAGRHGDAAWHARLNAGKVL
jgi:hypothetical protein